MPSLAEESRTHKYTGSHPNNHSAPTTTSTKQSTTQSHTCHHRVRHANTTVRARSPPTPLAFTHSLLQEAMFGELIVRGWVCCELTGHQMPSALADWSNFLSAHSYWSISNTLTGGKADFRTMGSFSGMASSHMFDTQTYSAYMAAPRWLTSAFLFP